MGKHSDGTDISSPYSNSADKYIAYVDVETISNTDSLSKTTPEKCIKEQFQDLQEFSVTSVEILSENASSTVIQGTISFSVTTTSSYMVEDVAADKIRDYIPEEFQLVNITHEPAE